MPALAQLPDEPTISRFTFTIGIVDEEVATRMSWLLHLHRKRSETVTATTSRPFSSAVPDFWRSAATSGPTVFRRTARAAWRAALILESRARRRRPSKRTCASAVSRASSRSRGCYTRAGGYAGALPSILRPAPVSALRHLVEAGDLRPPAETVALGRGGQREGSTLGLACHHRLRHVRSRPNSGVDPSLTWTACRGAASNSRLSTRTFKRPPRARRTVHWSPRRCCGGAPFRSSPRTRREACGLRSLGGDRRECWAAGGGAGRPGGARSSWVRRERRRGCSSLAALGRPHPRSTARRGFGSLRANWRCAGRLRVSIQRGRSPIRRVGTRCPGPTTARLAAASSRAPFARAPVSFTDDARRPGRRFHLHRRRRSKRSIFADVDRADGGWSLPRSTCAPARSRSKHHSSASYHSPRRPSWGTSPSAVCVATARSRCAPGISLSRLRRHR
jgi:hypothetical protein